MKLGAYHYVNKPFNLDEVVMLVEKALETSQLRREVRALRSSQGREYAFDAIIGASPAMQAIKALLARVAKSPASTVLLTGETGTGKDLAAKAIHYNSDRARRPFVNITMSALPEQLLESELFGHERGAFTDARQQKRGLLETADGGTVFLDEIGEMTRGAAGQAAAVPRGEDLQARRRPRRYPRRRPRHRRDEPEPRGGSHATASSARTCFTDCRSCRFALPPLRERHGDIPLLASYYIDVFNREFKRHVRGLSPEATTMLEQYQWPGNIREMRNAIERAMLLVDHEWLQPGDFTTLTRSVTPAEFKLPAEGISLDEVERQLLMQALERSGGNQTQAGQLLGINRDQVRYRIEKFGLGASGKSLSSGACTPFLLSRASRTVSTGHGAVLTTRSATLPISRCDMPPRPCVPMTIRSMSCPPAYSTIDPAGRADDRIRSRAEVGHIGRPQAILQSFLRVAQNLLAQPFDFGNEHFRGVDTRDTDLPRRGAGAAMHRNALATLRA